MLAFKASNFAKDAEWWDIVKQSSTTMGWGDWVVFVFCLGFPMAVGVFFMMQVEFRML